MKDQVDVTATDPYFQKMIFTLKITMSIKRNLYLNLIELLLPTTQIERIPILNIFQEFSTKSIYLKYQLPVGQSSIQNRMNYLINMLFKTLRVWRVKVYIIIFLV